MGVDFYQHLGMQNEFPFLFFWSSDSLFPQLSRQVVQNINLAGGSLLGVSRGGASVSDIVDSIQVLQIHCHLR